LEITGSSGSVDMGSKPEFMNISKVICVRENNWVHNRKFRKFPAILRNPKVHHRVHNSLPLVPMSEASYEFS
jgi:hypothetical protein